MSSRQKVNFLIRRLEAIYTAVQRELCLEAAQTLKTLLIQLDELRLELNLARKKALEPTPSNLPTTLRRRKKMPNFPPQTPVLDRLKTMVDKQKTTGCWNWMGYGSDQYGYVTIKKRTWLVHRLMFTLKLGRELDTVEQVMHRCDNTWCCNPDHLELGSAKKNRIDCVNKGRQGRGVGLATAKEMRVRYLKGETAKALSLVYGKTLGYVKNVVMGNSFKSLNEDPDILAVPKMQSKSRMSVLTPDSVKEIRDMLAMGIQNIVIAKKFSVHSSTVSQIKTGKRWGDIS